MSLLQPGEHLVSPRSGYQHHGLYLGDHQVIHYLGVSAGGQAGHIAITTLAEFCQGRGHSVMPHNRRTYDRRESIDRAYTRLGEAHYHVLFNNCEHFVLWCIEGFHYSPQINRLIAIGWGAQQALGAARRVPSTTPHPAAPTMPTTVKAMADVTPLTAVTSLLDNPLSPIPLALKVGSQLYQAWRWLND